MNTQPKLTLYRAPQLFSSVCWEVAQNVQVPVEMAVTTVLSAMSLAGQAVAEVESFNGSYSPLTLWFLYLGVPGERKSPVHKLVFSAVYATRADERERLRGLTERYKAEHRLWSRRRKELKRSIKEKTAEGEDTEQAFSELETHQLNEPKRPVAPEFVLSDTTPAALYRRLKEFPSASISADEGSSPFEGRTMNNSAQLNVLWDGNSIRIDRVSSDSFDLDAHLCIDLMMQPAILLELLKTNARMVQNGFLYRMNICQPETLQGDRFLKSLEQSWEHLPIFSKRLREVLVEGIRCVQERRRRRLQFSPEARHRLLEYANWVEAGLKVGSYLHTVRGQASKTVENVRRFAANLHLFFSTGVEIQLKDVETAIELGAYFLSEAHKIFASQEVDADVREARELAEWMRHQVVLRRGRTAVTWTELRRYGPNHLRPPVALNAALQTLEQWGWLHQEAHGRTRVIVLHALHFAEGHCAQATPAFDISQFLLPPNVGNLFKSAL